MKAHNGEKSNKCDQCDFASSQAGNLRRHLKSHSREKLNKLNQPVVKKEELEESSIRVGGKLQNDLDEYDIKVRKSMIGTVNFDKSKKGNLKLCTIC